MVQQMQALSNAQYVDLRKEADPAGNLLPRVCVDRGVMENENECDDQACTSFDMDMVPSSVSVTLSQADSWKRSCLLNCYETAYGEKPERVYASMFPFNFGGLCSNQIKKIVRDLSSKKLRKKSRAEADSDDLARKASEMKLSSAPNSETNLLNKVSEMNSSSEMMDISDNQLMNPVPGKYTQFHISHIPSSHPDEDDIMALSDLLNSLFDQPKH